MQFLHLGSHILLYLRLDLYRTIHRGSLLPLRTAHQIYFLWLNRCLRHKGLHLLAREYQPFGFSARAGCLVVARRLLLQGLTEKIVVRLHVVISAHILLQSLPAHKWINSIIPDRYGRRSRIPTVREVFLRERAVLWWLVYSEPLILRFGISRRQLAAIIQWRAVRQRRLHLFESWAIIICDTPGRQFTVEDVETLELVELFLQNQGLLLPIHVLCSFLLTHARKSLTVAAPMIWIVAGHTWVAIAATKHYGPVSVFCSIHVTSVWVHFLWSDCRQARSTLFIF